MSAPSNAASLLALDPEPQSEPAPVTRVESERPTASASEASDEALLARIAEGDRGAFALLLQRHLARTVALARRTLGRLGDTDADDIAQEAFTRLWTRAASWQGETTGARFTTWFHRIVVNLCIDHARRKRPDALPEDWDAPDDSPGVEEDLASRALALHVRAAIDQLPARQRTALHLCVLERRSNAEAAEILGVGIKALESLLVRGRRALKIALKEVYDEHRD